MVLIVLNKVLSMWDKLEFWRVILRIVSAIEQYRPSIKENTEEIKSSAPKQENGHH